jgi:hypothetical protein
MDYIGLFRKFRINRPLSDFEAEHRLTTRQAAPAYPWYQGTVIQINSTYLDLYDKFFAQKGIATTVFIALIAMIGVFLFYMGKHTFNIWPNLDDERKINALYHMIYICVICLTPVFVMGVLLKKEALQYTHYPIRFNRKNKMVYVFRQNGTVMAERWDNLWFTLSDVGGNDLEVRGHRLDKDGKTVLETFALPYYADKKDPGLLSLWEFVRLYMAEGPDAVPKDKDGKGNLADQIEVAPNIAVGREGFWDGFTMFRAHGSPVVTLFFPLFVLYAIGRAIAMITGKRPVWPEEVEKECEFSPDDPYLRDARHLAEVGAAVPPWLKDNPPKPRKSEVDSLYD